MDVQLWLAYVLAASVLLAIPGPTILTVIGYSLTHGYRARVPLVLAVALGDATALGLSLVGLGALLGESAFWFRMVKWAGGLYLLYLGLQLVRTGLRSDYVINSRPAVMPGKKLFLNTWLVTALNPKGIVFFVAFLPQFVDRSGNVTFQLWLLALTFIVLATVNTALYAFFAGKAQRFLSAPDKRRLFDLGGGSVLSLAGLWALSARQS